MPPVTVSAVGMVQQMTDDPKLKELLKTLCEVETIKGSYMPDDIPSFLQILSTCQEWKFEEQVDLYEWIKPLDKIDAILSKILIENPSLLLVAPLKRQQSPESTTFENDTQDKKMHAESLEDISNVSDATISSLKTILTFLSVLLGNSCNKNAFNSVDELVDLLACFDDGVSDLALQALTALATPPALHRLQQTADMHHHQTNLHKTINSHVHARLLALARGWGSRASDVGLYNCVTTDDSEYGQGALLKECGEVNFEYYDSEKGLVKLHLSMKDMMTQDGSSSSMEDEEQEQNKQKRRRMGSMNTGGGRGMQPKEMKTTAELFFQCLEQAGGRSNIVSDDQQFNLLAEVRLAAAFHSRETRICGVERRLRALIANLYTHSNHDILSGYFQAQPELFAELTDLLRPTVSSAAVSAASAVSAKDSDEGELPAMSALANSPQVPYNVRTLALGTLSALVQRRDSGSSGGLAGVARLTNVLTELGVGKGMYLGILSTLIRYSLASLTAFLSSDDRNKSEAPVVEVQDPSEKIGMDLGRAFVKAAKAPLPPVAEQLHRALAFIDSVLSLTSAVISTPSGTAALTECGLVPALLSTVSTIDSPSLEKSSAKLALSSEDLNQARAMLRFIMSQAVQIIEGAVVIHNHALSALLELNGADVLVLRLHDTIEDIRKANGAQVSPSEDAMEVENMDGVSGDDKPTDGSAMECDPMEENIGGNVDNAESEAATTARQLTSSQRILLFCLVNGLSNILSQEAGSRTAPTSSSGAQLKKPELTGALAEILRNVGSYGGAPAAVVSTLMCDIMNNEPQVVHYVHESGLAKAFFHMLMGSSRTLNVDVLKPGFPASQELIIAISNTLAALALTEDGANVVAEVNPFPAFLSLVYSPEFALPKSRCLLNEMTAIVGTGLDEVIRNVPKLKPIVLAAVVEAVNHIADIGEKLQIREAHNDGLPRAEPASALENDRSVLIQYILNITEMLEQLVSNDDHCEPFVSAGGLDAVLRLFPLTTPATPSFLAHVSCLSCQSTCTLASSNTEDSILVVIKSISLNCDTTKLLKKVTTELDTALVKLKQVQAQLRENFPADGTCGNPSDEMSADGVLEGLPRAPLHTLVDDNNFMPKAVVLSKYFRQVTILQWYTNILTSAIRGGLSRSQGSGADWGRNEREWKNELSSDSFRKLFDQLSLFHTTALLESCRIRTEDGYEERERVRQSERLTVGSVRYRLRIVCPEGAVVRDGIDIDSCLSVGSAEFGDIVEAIDRCHNSSGVLRYRTRVGWISELTRGHGRETIAEVLNVWPGKPEEDPEKETSTPKSKNKRKEFGVSDVCATGASIFARLQSSYCDLTSSLSRVVTQGMRALPARRLVFDEGSVGLHISSLTFILSSNLLRGMNLKPIRKTWNGEKASGTDLSPSGAAMYLSVLLTIVHSCLVDDKRDRATLNVFLLMALMETDPLVDQVVAHNAVASPLSIFAAVQFVFKQCLLDLSNPVPTAPSSNSEGQPPAQSVPRTVAASLPPTIDFLRKLSKAPLISSNAATIIKRFKEPELSTLVGCKTEGGLKISQPLELARSLYCMISKVTLEMWLDDRFVHVPVQLAWPLSGLAGDIMSSLEQSLKGASTSTNDAESRSIWNIFSRSASSRGARGQLGIGDQPDSNREEFEPSEEAISRLTEMGFTRDHALEALEATGSNHIEIAMEYALSRPPSSPRTVERRRAEREERRRRREEANAQASQQGTSGVGESSGDAGEAAPAASDVIASSGSEASASASAADDTTKESKAAIESLEDKLKGRVEEFLKDWIDRSPNAVFNILMSCGPNTASDKEGDGDMEALAIAMNTFLVEMCLKNPDEMNRIVSDLLDRVKAEIKVDESTCIVRPGRERAFSSLCHMAGLMTRELSGTRRLILEKGLVGILVGCLENMELEPRSGDKSPDTTRTWPIWAAPALLVLENMAQPIVGFNKEKLDTGSPPHSEETELQKVRELHKKQTADLAETARILFPAGTAPTSEVTEVDKEAKEDSKPSDEVDSSPKDAPIEKDTSEALSLLSVPSLAPLIPDDLAAKCFGICMKILDGKSDDNHCSPQPGIAHATFLLLSRLVRSPNLSTAFLQTRAIDTILALPRSSRFKGTTGIVSILLRRLLEDPLTLQASMETEIRSVVSKKNEHRMNSESDDMPSISVTTFARSLDLLICRDPLVFLKAASVTVRFQNRAGDTPLVVLLTSEERTARRAYLHEKVLLPITETKDTAESLGSQPGTPQTPSRSPKAKHHRRGSPSKRGSHSKKARHAGPESSAKKSGSGETASNCIMFALMTKAISVYRSDDEDCDSLLFGNQTSFLWIGSIFDIMSDLVLAFPACAAAVHRYRPAIPKAMFSHALSGCPPPQRNFVNLLLHQLLPQDRQTVKQDPLEQGNMENEETKSKRTQMIVKMRAAQTAARVLVSSVARSGEGRQRVLSDLAFALSGGRHGFDGVSPTSPQGVVALHQSEMDALQAWGDLCIGLAAPRSTGQDYERNSYLSFEMIKAMLELGMGHALLYALWRVDLQHPKAPLVCASLLIPFEVFTRVSVTDAVQSIAQKEFEEKSKRSRAQETISEQEDKGEKPPTAFVDDTMLEDGFRNVGDGNVDIEMDSEEEESAGGSDEEVSSNDDEDGDAEEDDDDDEDDSDEDSQDDQGTIEEQSDSESEMSGVDEAGVEPMDIVEEDDEDDRWGAEAEDFLHFVDGESGAGGPGQVAPRHGESDLDEGWTRVETGESGEGNLRVFDGGQAISAAAHAAFMGGGNSVSARNRGFLDVAEAMIGSLLRAGQLQPDSVADLENSLGIRVVARNISGNGGMMFGQAPARDFQASRGSEIGTARLIRAANRGGAGVNTNSIPSIRQRNPPEISAFHGGRWTESSTEHLYGDITAGNRNYDVISPIPGDTDDDLVYPSVATQLFPGGPSASTHSRMQLMQHPLFSGVELPPVNALVTNLRSSEERAALRDLTGGVPRGELYSSYYGSSRSSSNTGTLGWTDDGLPLDETMARFTTAFGSALSTFQPTPPEQEAPTSSTEQVGGAEGQNQSSGADQEGEDEQLDTQLGENGPPSQEEQAGAGGAQAASDSQGPAENAGSEDATMQEANVDSDDDRPMFSDGDGVASSLATGLRLSPGNETHTENDADVAASADHMVDGPSDTARETQEHGAAGEEQIVREAETDENGGVESGQDQAQDGSSEQVPAASESTGLVCPPGMDLEVFNSLPVDMQQEIAAQHQSAAEVAAQLDSASGLDPEVLAALPEDMRREAIEQEQRERRQREEAPADPSNAEEMDNASFLASLAPNLREEILLTADETFLNSLPPNIIAEANLLRERASTRYRQVEDSFGVGARQRSSNGQLAQEQAGGTSNSQATARRKIRLGRVKLDCDKPDVLYLGKPGKNQLSSPIGYSTMEALFRLMYLRSPVRPQKLLQKVFQNLSAHRSYRGVALAVFVNLLNENTSQAVEALRSLQQHYSGEREWRKVMDDEFVVEGEFPPSSLIGAPPEIMDVNAAPSNFLRRRLGASAASSIAANIPTSSRGTGDHQIPQVVASRMIESLLTLTRNVPRSCIDALSGSHQDNMADVALILESLLDLLGKPRYSNSSTNLEQLLSLIESVVAPLSSLPRLGDEAPPALTQEEIEAADALGKEWLDVPRPAVSRDRLELLCSILRNENCKDAAFTKVNLIARRLCRETHNRSCILLELAGVAQSLGSEASRDLRALQVRMDDAIKSHQEKLRSETSSNGNLASAGAGRSLSSSVTLSTSSSELKLLRVLQTLQTLCTDHSHEDQTKKSTGLTVVTEDLLKILRHMDLESLWSQLTDCLKKVKILEGVASLRELEDENAAEGNNEEADDTSHEKSDKKKLQNSVVGLLSRFMPMIEAFFVVNASATRDIAATDKPDDSTEALSPSNQDSSNKEDEELNSLVNGERVVEFVTANRILLNALIRNNPSLLEKGLRAMVQVSRCRVLLDFDVKRQWFKTQMRRLRQQASRRHGSLRLVIRREHVFEDAYHMLRLRNADEMRGRLHITFQQEEGVDAGGLSREFFGILAKEIFNPNYALFTSTEDGCTFQPNPNSSINPDHLSYFRFVGRIVGKAVADGYLLDAHFTRSLYKHMLGVKPTHHDMEAIDPDYYKNLKMILEFNLADIGLDLTFSIEDHSFGRSQIIDLKPDGRNIHVTEETKAEYVRLVCQHRMTTAISSQIKAYLDGFHEMVSKDLIAIFTPKELELLISGLPDIDVVDLKRNTDYHGYRATDKEIQWFWNIMFSLSRNEKASFLQFVTGSSKVPLAGFSELQGMRGVQKFSIHKANGQSGALMSAHTCFNSLDLPVYESEEEMREKLLLSISEGGGAFLFA